MNGTQKLDFSDKLVSVKIFGKEIKFLNLFKLTMYEHLQTLFVFLYVIYFDTCAIQIPTFIILFTNWTPRFRYIFILYLFWVFYDRNAHKKGRRWQWFRRLRLFKLYNDYFPIRLIKTAELTPDRNYILAMYPHGVLSVNLITNFGFYVNNVDKLYPNIDIGYVTVNFTTKAPILRELYLGVGARSPDKSDVENYLNSKPSKALVIIPDGADGATFSQPGKEYFFRKTHRKGFIRIALKTGASLVPVFAFGENNVLTVVKLTGWYKSISEFLYKITRVRFVLVNGAGLFQQSFGIMPRRVPINTVVGKPIPVPKVENPSEELIDEYLEKFFKELENLFEEHKHQYDPWGSEAKMTYI